MISIGFLSKYIEENQSAFLDDILNDDEFLEELKIKNDFLLK